MHENPQNHSLDHFSDLAVWKWLNEPTQWSVIDGGNVRLEPKAQTDFWQRTHYGFRVDNGHFLFQNVTGDFVLTARASFRPVHQYDQAGIMVRISADSWIKSSVEFEPHGPARLGAVVTNFGYSDWSTEDFPAGSGQLWFRVRREADDYIVDVSPDGNAWRQLRMAHLHEGRGAASVAAGVYACSPKGAGFVAAFDNVTVRAGRV